MRTIPDDVLDAIAAHRPHLAPMIANLRAAPPVADQIERALADAYLMGETRLSAQQTYWLAASAAGHPYGRYVDLDYAAHLSGYDPSHLGRLLRAGTLAGVRWRGQWYADRAALAGLDRSPAGRPRKEGRDGAR